MSIQAGDRMPSGRFALTGARTGVVPHVDVEPPREFGVGSAETVPSRL